MLEQTPISHSSRTFRRNIQLLYQTFEPLFIIPKNYSEKLKQNALSLTIDRAFIILLPYLSTTSVEDEEIPY
jgi:hypothetical protein